MRILASVRSWERIRENLRNSVSLFSLSSSSCLRLSISTAPLTLTYSTKASLYLCSRTRDRAISIWEMDSLIRRICLRFHFCRVEFGPARSGGASSGLHSSLQVGASGRQWKPTTLLAPARGTRRSGLWGIRAVCFCSQTVCLRGLKSRDWLRAWSSGLGCQRCFSLLWVCRLEQSFLIPSV